MDREYLLFANVKLALDREATARVQEKLRLLGVTILRAGLGTILLRASPSVAKKLADALPGWKVTVQRKGTVGIPEKRPLVQARQRITTGRSGGLEKGRSGIH